MRHRTQRSLANRITQVNGCAIGTPLAEPRPDCDDQHDHVAEVTCLLDLDVKAADRFGESLEKGTHLIAGVVGDDLILELHLRVEDGIEVRTQFARPVHMLDETTGPLNALSCDIAYAVSRSMPGQSGLNRARGPHSRLGNAECGGRWAGVGCPQRPRHLDKTAGKPGCDPGTTAPGPGALRLPPLQRPEDRVGAGGAQLVAAEVG